MWGERIYWHVELVSREFRTQAVALLKTLPDLDTEARRTALLAYLPASLKAAIPRDPSPAIDLQNIVTACADWQPPPDYAAPHPLALLLATARSFAPVQQHSAWNSLLTTAPAALGAIPVVERPRVPLAVSGSAVAIITVLALGVLVLAVAVLLPIVNPPATTPLATRIPENMVALAGGPYLLGTDDPTASDDERPATIVALPPFKIDRYEVTNREYAQCIDDHATCSPPVPDRTHNIDKDALPVVGVTAGQAAQYCAWRGKSTRLSHEEEWERAVRGLGTTPATLRPWPWGNSPDVPNPTVANIYPPVGTPQPPGSHALDRSPEADGGVYDLVGNVREWTSSYYTLDYSSGPAHWEWTGISLKDPTSVIIRGGSVAVPLDRATQRGAEDGRDGRFEDVGFRCARDNP